MRHSSIRSFKFAVCLVLALCGFALADEQKGAPLRLRVGDVAIARTPAAQSAAAANERWVAQLDGAPNEERKLAIENTGAVIESYLPDNAFILRLPNVAPASIEQIGFVRAVTRYAPDWKLDPCVATVRSNRTTAPRAAYRQTLDATRAALFDEGKVRLLVTTFRDESSRSTTANLAAMPDIEVGQAVEAGGRTIVDIVAPLDRIADVADAPFVQFIEDAPRGTLRNNLVVTVVQSGTNTLTPIWDHGLHGEGQIVGLIDGAPYLTHCMFTDTEPVGPTHRKFVAFRIESPYSSNSHGTHVAGTIAGDGGVWNEYTLYDGVAYAARISFSDYFDVYYNPTTLLPRLIDAHNDGAHVHSNSWGDDTTTAYTTWCMLADQFSHDYEDDLVCFATTNLTTLRSPENAKNVISVAASQQYPNIDYLGYGGSGPTFDGRRKPEIITPGVGIRSASISACSTSLSSGTSHACPSVAASAALIRQYYESGFYPTGSPQPADGFVASGALMKATLLNAAVDMTGIAGYPSDQEGWGRLELDGTLRFEGQRRRLIVRDVRNASGLLTGGSSSFTFSVLAPGEDVRVTLVFTDPPGVVGSADPVVNDLDLVVTAPFTGVIGGNVFLGNYFKNGQSGAGGTADTRNNVEQVYLVEPATGTYTVEVNATAVNGLDPQGFAVVVSGRVVEGAYDPPAGYADADADGDTDLADYAAYQRCCTSAGQPYVDPSCATFDADADGDVDADDYAPFQVMLASPTGP